MGTGNSKIKPKRPERLREVCSSQPVQHDKLPVQCVDNPEGVGCVIIYDNENFPMAKQRPTDKDTVQVIMEH